MELGVVSRAGNCSSEEAGREGVKGPGLRDHGGTGYLT